MTQLVVSPAAFWGNRYQVRRRPYGKSGSVYEIFDSANERQPVVSISALRGQAQGEADKLNADPSANYNGDSWPKVHYANVYDPEESCDCQDPRRPYPKPDDWRVANLCGGIVGTFCKTHGCHDTCPRDIRGVNLSTDEVFLAHHIEDLERRREDLARTEAYIEREAERLERLERLAVKFAC